VQSTVKVVLQGPKRERRKEVREFINREKNLGENHIISKGELIRGKGYVEKVERVRVIRINS